MLCSHETCKYDFVVCVSAFPVTEGGDIMSAKIIAPIAVGGIVCLVVAVVVLVACKYVS